MKRNASIIPEARIERLILLFRGQKVMLDEDLAELYGETTSRLLEAVRRQIRRFPEDFMFQLSNQEVMALRSQIAITKATDIAYRSATGDSLQVTTTAPVSCALRGAWGERLPGGLPAQRLLPKRFRPLQAQHGLELNVD